MGHAAGSHRRLLAMPPLPMPPLPMPQPVVMVMKDEEPASESMERPHHVQDLWLQHPSELSPPSQSSQPTDMVNISIVIERHDVHRVHTDNLGKRLLIVSNARKFNVEVMLLNRETHQLVLDVQLQLRAELMLENGCAVENKVQTGEPLLLGEPLALVMGGHARFLGLQLGKTALTSFCDKQLFRLQIRPADDATFDRYPNLSCITEPFKSVTKLFRGERFVRESGPIDQTPMSLGPPGAMGCSSQQLDPAMQGETATAAGIFDSNNGLYHENLHDEHVSDHLHNVVEQLRAELQEAQASNATIKSQLKEQQASIKKLVGEGEMMKCELENLKRSRSWVDPSNTYGQHLNDPRQ